MTEQLEFVDSHVHFFDRSVPDLQWDWLAHEYVHPIWGSPDGFSSYRYTATEFARESRFNNVSKCVHVQAAIGSPDPVAETAWLQLMADEGSFPQAIIADARLQEPNVGNILERHAEYSNMRGIRDFGVGKFLTDRHFEQGYAHLSRYGWLYELASPWQEFDDALALARRHPSTTMVVEHCGFPSERTDEYFTNWRSALRRLGSAPNTVIKISGLGMGDPDWTLTSLRPWIQECLGVFGLDRAFSGTNWPLDRLFSSYTDVVQAYRELISDLTIGEQRSLLSGTAARIYGI